MGERLFGFWNNLKEPAAAIAIRHATSNLLTGKSVDYLNFLEICQELGLDWKAIAQLRVSPKPT